MKTLTLIITAAWLLAAPNPAAAQWTSDPYHGMANVCDAPGTQYPPKTHSLAGGRTLIIWQDGRRPLISLSIIFYQVLDSCGNSLLPDNGLPLIEGDWFTFWPDMLTQSRITADDGSGGCIIVFTDFRDSTADIYGQRIDSLGNRLWGPTGVHLVTWPGPSSIRVDTEDFVSDPLGNYFLFFKVQYDTYPYFDIDAYAQKFTAEGDILWGPSGTPTCAGPDIMQANQIALPDQQGGAMIAFAREEVLPNVFYAYAQHLDTQGNQLFGPGGREIYHHNGYGIGLTGGHLSGCVPDNEGGGVWSYDDNYYCYLIHLDSLAQESWIRFRQDMPFTDAVQLLRHPQDGSIWWLTSGHGYGTEPPLKYSLQRYDLDGNQFFGPQGIHMRQGEQLVPTASGNVINVGYSGTPYKTRLFAQSLDTNGITVWETTVALGATPSYGGTAFYKPNACSDGNEGVVVAFSQNYGQSPGNSNGISGQRVHSNGRLGCALEERIIPSKTRLIRSLSDDLMEYMIPQASKIKLELYDLLGRRVALIEEGYKEAGRYSAHWQTEGLAAGVYFVRLQAGGEVAVKKTVLVR
jgi:hypothetical protein